MALADNEITNCQLYGEVNIELFGTNEIEIVLEGELNAIQLEGQIDIDLDSMNDIYLGAIKTDPYLEAGLGLTLNLEACITTNDSYVNAIAKPCCDNLDAVLVQVLETSIPTVNSLANNYQGQGFIYNGNCYHFTSIGGTGTPVATILPDDYIYSICTNSICPECATPTPTITPTITPTPTITQSPTITPTITQSITPTNVIICNVNSGTWVAGWIKENYDGTPQSTYFQTGLIDVLPSNLPDPNNISNPINYDKIVISRYEQGGVDMNSTFNYLDGANSGTITLGNVYQQTVTYNISNIDYVNNSYLLLNLSGVAYSQIDSYENGVTYGICIDADLPTPTPTTTNTLTPTQTPTQSVTPTITPTITPTTTLTPSDPCYCKNYSIDNNDKGETLSIEYVDCNTLNVEINVVPTDTITTQCSCSTPIRVFGSTNYTITLLGPCT